MKKILDVVGEAENQCKYGKYSYTKGNHTNTQYSKKVLIINKKK